MTIDEVAGKAAYEEYYKDSPLPARLRTSWEGMGAKGRDLWCRVATAAVEAALVDDSVAVV